MATYRPSIPYETFVRDFDRAHEQAKKELSEGYAAAAEAARSKNRKRYDEIVAAVSARHLWNPPPFAVPRKK